MFAKLFKWKTKYYPDFLSWARYLIPQVKKEFLKKEIGKVVSKAMDEHVLYKTEAYYRWGNGIGSFSLADHILGVAFVVTHLANYDCSMLEIVLYSKNGYKASCHVLSFKIVDELFQWLNQKDTPEKCSSILLELLKDLESPD